MRSLGLKVQTATEAGLVRHPDENYIGYALRRGMVLVTCDRNDLDRRRFPLIHRCAILAMQQRERGPVPDEAEDAKGVPPEAWRAGWEVVSIQPWLMSTMRVMPFR